MTIFICIVFLPAINIIACPDINAVYETGFLGVVSHNIQFSKNGTEFDYRNQGGQDVLFPVQRFELNCRLKKTEWVLLYQPLRLETSDLLQKDVRIDNAVFPAGKGIKCIYNFPFYRLSWLRELTKKRKRMDFALGLSAQIRNATITFESSDGEVFRSESDIGFVPALKMKFEKRYKGGKFIGIEADGIFAPVSYLNGSDKEIKGAILDAAFRTGVKLRKKSRIYLSTRYIGGGAVGTNSDDPGPGDGYVDNWLHFFNLSAGFTYDLK